VPALVNSGLPNDRFVFEGFLPDKKGRQTRLLKLVEETRTMIFYVSPHKLVKTLMEFTTYFGALRRASISRELTKLHEETLRGTRSYVHILRNIRPRENLFLFSKERNNIRESPLWDSPLFNK